MSESTKARVRLQSGSGTHSHERGDEPGVGDRDPERDLEAGDDPVREHEAPDSIDVQPEDPDYPGRESPEPIH